MLGLGNSLAGGAALQGKLPNEISGLQIWLKNDTGITSDGGSPDLVEQWNDQSGGSRHIQQTTDADKATKVDGGIDLSSANPEDHYEFAVGDGRVDVGGSNAFTLAVVMKREGADDDPNAFFGGNSNSRYIMIADEETITYRTTGTGAATSSYTFATDTWVINTQMVLTVTKDTSGNFLFYKNGTLVTPSSTSNPTNTGEFNDVQYFACRRDGTDTSDFTFDGKIYEFVLYNALLSAGDLSDLNSHLKSKFSL